MKALSLNVNLRSTLSSLTGVQRYALEVFQRLEPYIATRNTRPAATLGAVGGQLWEQFLLPWKLRSGELLWSPANVGPLSVSRQVVTIHDAATFDHPEWFKGMFSRWYRFLLPLLARRCRGVVTVSHDAKRRLVNHLGVPEEKVKVIWNGVSQALKPARSEDVAELRARYGIRPQSRYFAYVGSLEPRKNLSRLMNAWEEASLGPGFQLIVAGSAGKVFSGGGCDRLPAGCRAVGRISDEELVALLSGAYGFVYPSLYEGFGLPPLEAMACGARLGISDIPVLREVCGDVAMYFDPLDTRSIAKVLVEMAAEKEANRNEAVRRGLAHVQQFTWEKSAQEHANYFRELERGMIR